MSPERGGRLRALAIEHGGAVTLAILVFYVWRACPYVVENDQAEMSTLGAIGGVAHPPSFPLHLLWLRAWSWLPAASPAHAASLATALIGGLTVLVLHAAARAWGARPLAATAAVGIYALAPLVARYHTMAEVFALNHLVVASVLWLAAERGPLRGWARALALGLVAGLGLCNHTTCVLVAPVGLLGVVRAARDGARAPAIAAALGGLVVGLLPYGYLLLAPDNLASFRHPEGLGDLVDIFLRRAYGGPFAFSGAEPDTSRLAHLVALGGTLAGIWAWVLLPVVVGGLVAGVARPVGERRAAWISLAAAIVLAGPVLVLRFDLPLDAYGRWVAQRFHLLPATLLVIPVAVGLDRLGRWLGAQVPTRLSGGTVLGVLVTLALVSRAATTLPDLARYQTPALENFARNLLAGLPPNTIVIGAVNEIDVGIRYQHLALGRRPDVLYFRLEGLLVDWYRARMAASGIPLPSATPAGFEVAFAESLLATGRPLVMGIGYGDGRVAPLARYPLGLVVRVLPRGAVAPSIAEVLRLNEALFASYDLAYPRPRIDDEAAAWMHHIYARVWTQMADVFARAGDGAAAARAQAIAAQLAPLE